MFDHVTIRASDSAASTAFYRTVLGAIGIQPTHALAGFVDWDDFSILPADGEHPATGHLHIGFAASSRADVDSFWQAGIDAGYRDDGPPGERPVYGPQYYGGFLLDPDGNSAEAVHDRNVRCDGHVDHLWIGVTDLAAAEGFYRLLSPFTGGVPGRRETSRAQFRGPSGTFSLLRDGRPITEGLHMAFAAPDRETVREFHHAAVKAGYRDNGAPAERPRYHPGYFSAYVVDPDGTNVESVFHDRGRR